MMLAELELALPPPLLWPLGLVDFLSGLLSCVGVG